MILLYFRERGREGERGWKKHWSVTFCLLHAPRRAERRAQNPGMCLDWELNWWPFSLQDDAQPTEPHWSGQYQSLFKEPVSSARLKVPSSRDGTSLSLRSHSWLRKSSDGLNGISNAGATLRLSLDCCLADLSKASSFFCDCSLSRCDG